jgi:tRNA 5-methylaminomethyl-2-thiouridine biosynthesis bifunctional protein
VADNVENLTMLDGLSPALRTAFDIDARDAGSLEGRAALRCVSADYLPVTGLVADSQGQVTPGLYTSLAHGSRGLVTAPLSGEILAAWLDDEPAPLPLELMRAISPLRLRAPQPDWQENVASARQPGAPGEREQ